MSNTVQLFTPLECMQVAWAVKLRDFKQWVQPTTQALYNWKARRLESAIMVTRGTMMDDVETILKAIQEEDTARTIGDTHESGTSVYLPVMVTAIQPLVEPPEREQVVDLGYWSNVIIPTDPLNRLVQMRTQAVSYRCQIAFFAPDPHSASSIGNQFANFWKRESKRTFPVLYEMGFAGTHIVSDRWDFRVFENTLTPSDVSSSIDGNNMHIITVDCTLVGAEPIVVGLGALWDKVTDKGEPIDTLPPGMGGGGYDGSGNPVPGGGYDGEGNPIPGGGGYDGSGNPVPGGGGYDGSSNPVPGGITPADELGRKVIEADIIDHNVKIWSRVAINPDTKVITQTGGTLP